jgi:hypothetical protein
MNISEIIFAIVDFQVSYEVHGPSLQESRALTSVSSIHNQYDILPLNWIDGDRLTTTVKAILTKRMSLVQSGKHHHFIKFNLFSS